MKKLIALSAIGVLFVGCTVKNEELQAPGPGPVYKTPEVAVEQLAIAAEQSDGVQLKQVLGYQNSNPGSTNLADNEVRAMANFSTLLKQKYELEEEKNNLVRLNVGEPKRRFPIPLKAVNGGWQFDLKAGQEEVNKQAMRKNELRALAVGREIIEAQKKYAEHDYDNDRVLEFTPRFISSEGQRDGLYWPSTQQTVASPINLSIAKAGIDSSMDSSMVQVPVNGYLFKILSEDHKGSFADSQGNLERGIAILAFPAKYNSTGTLSYVFNTEGKIYQKDMGAETPLHAQNLNRFSRDDDWEKVIE